MIAALGILVGALLILMKLLPFVPGHFTGYEYLGLGLWAFTGLVLNRREKANSTPAPARAEEHPTDD